MAGRIWKCTDEEYNADRTRLRSTHLRVFRRSRPEYHDIYVARTSPEPEPSPEQVIGTALHCLVLLGTIEFERRYCVAPHCDRRTKEGKIAWEMFLAENQGKVAMKSDQMVAVTGMAESIWKHPIAGPMIEKSGERELAVTWESDHDMPCKCRFDLITSDEKVADIKTASDPYPTWWPSHCRKLGYDLQAAFYADGFEELTGFGLLPENFFWIVVGSSPPFETIVYSPESVVLNYARMQCDSLIRELKEQDWTSRFHSKVETVAWRNA